MQGGQINSNGLGLTWGVEVIIVPKSAQERLLGPLRTTLQFNQSKCALTDVFDAGES
jgi:hypothetical protein